MNSRAGTASYDVVICGAGVGGLAAACAFDSRGLRVLLLEKQRQQRAVAKGEVLQPGSVRILRAWGVLDKLEQRNAVRLDRLAIRDADGRELITFDYRTLAGQYRWLLTNDYPAILGVLAESLTNCVEWRRGVLVEDLVRDTAGRVVGVRVLEGTRRYEVRSGLVVAADGISSRLRRAAGITAKPVEYDHRLLSFELSDAAAVANEVSEYLTSRGLCLVYPLPGGRARLYAQIGTDEFRSMGSDGLVSWCERLVTEVPALRPLADPLQAGVASRQLLPVWRFTASHLVIPGLALVGEAGHAVHPMAAQGMNSAIADAHALAEQLSATESLDPGPVDGALLAYQHERARWVDHIDQLSHKAATMITDMSWSGRVFGRHMLRGTARNPRLRYKATYNMAGLGMRPMNKLDRLHQLGLFDPRAHRVPTWS